MGRNSAPAALQPLVSSASSLPGSHRAPSMAAETPLDPETHVFYSNQQKIHEEERELWDKQTAIWKRERTDLWKRIQQLEALVSTLKNGSSVVSPKGSTSQMGDRFCPYPPPPQPPQISNGTARQVWEGPETHSTRTFSEPTNTFPIRSSEPLRSIPEHGEIGPRKSVGFQITSFDTKRSRSGSSNTSTGGIALDTVHPDYDSIIFKSSSAPAEINKISGDSDNPSPGTAPQKPEPLIRPKLLDIPTANRNSERLYSQDAGHTPLARLDGDESMPSSRNTPTLPLEVERPPFEPRPSQMRQPNERADSYFPAPDSIANDSALQHIDEDPALKGPLIVSSGNKQDTFSLDEVSSRLEKLVEKETNGSDQSPSHGRGSSEETDIPKLRMKRSTNFGAPFGETGIGRGVEG